ncbi:MAG: hypothetical protein ACJA2D_001688 [Pseudohongiellaceae bacterium]|jgi:hypothetical protein
MPKVSAIALIFLLSITQSELTDGTQAIRESKLLQIEFIDNEKYDVTADELRRPSHQLSKDKVVLHIPSQRLYQWRRVSP